MKTAMNEAQNCFHPNQHTECIGGRLNSDCDKKELGPATSTAVTRQLTKPIPENCSDRYASGWAYADWHISKGGSLHAEAPDNWNEDQVNGFWDRLTAERNILANPAH